MENKPENRILSIDIMRGLTLFLMLFVNDLFVGGVPDWLTHMPADFDGMGLADWVFPGFLFMVGMAIPFAVRSRRRIGESNRKILLHILLRAISLLFIGVLMLNSGRLNSNLSGINKNLWAILMYFAVFLIWNNYSFGKKWIIYGLKSTGFAILIFLLLIFRSGTPESPDWLQTGWWGILGLIGWGYLVAGFVCILFGENILKVGMVTLAFLILNVLDQSGTLGFLNFLYPVAGILIQGNIPFIVLTGMLASFVLLKTGKSNFKKVIIYGIIAGLVFIVIGFILRHWFIISKIKGTPSWGFICNGISLLIFMGLFIIIDVFKSYKWANVFKAAGQNSLTTYLAPNILYYIIWMSGFPLFFYKQSDSQLLTIVGSLLWALAMIGFSVLLAKIGIRLKL